MFFSVVKNNFLKCIIRLTVQVVCTIKATRRVTFWSQLQLGKGGREKWWMSRMDPQQEKRMQTRRKFLLPLVDFDKIKLFRCALCQPVCHKGLKPDISHHCNEQFLETKPLYCFSILFNIIEKCYLPLISLTHTQANGDTQITHLFVCFNLYK